MTKRPNHNAPSRWRVFGVMPRRAVNGHASLGCRRPIAPICDPRPRIKPPRTDAIYLVDRIELRIYQAVDSNVKPPNNAKVMTNQVPNQENRDGSPGLTRPTSV